MLDNKYLYCRTSLLTHVMNFRNKQTKELYYALEHKHLCCLRYTGTRTSIQMVFVENSIISVATGINENAVEAVLSEVPE